MAYDHSTKAGNRGDVVKHVALIAALIEVLKGWRDERFLFADTFAGYAHNPLRPNKKGSDGWETGIGHLRNRGVGPIRTRSVRLWWSWYVEPRPQMQHGTYPGSTAIALDVAAEVMPRKFLHVAAWDTSASAVASLMDTLGTKRHSVWTRPAGCDDDDVRKANFLLIDPPNQDEHWSKIVDFIDCLDRTRAQTADTLVWLPLHLSSKPDASGNRPISKSADHAWIAAKRRGFHGIRVSWYTGQPAVQALVGCQLFYRLSISTARAAVRSAVSDVASLPAWKPSWHFTDLS